MAGGDLGNDAEHEAAVNGLGFVVFVIFGGGGIAHDGVAASNFGDFVDTATMLGSLTERGVGCMQQEDENAFTFVVFIAAVDAIGGGAFVFDGFAIVGDVVALAKLLGGTMGDASAVQG